jgi:tight adherence protein C
METIFDLIDFLLAEPSTLALAVAVAAGLGGAVLGAQWLMARADVKRRTLRLAADGPTSARETGRPQASPGPKAFLANLTASIDKLFGEGDAAASRILRKRMIQAGFYGSNAPAVFLTVRLGALLGLGAVGLGLGLAADDHMTAVYLKLVIGAGLGYLAPPLVLDRIIASRKDQHRAGFPDFLDLMIVCSEAGLSMEAGINRVCREMAGSYPSLSANLYFATLEIRAGRTMNDALNNLADRLGIEEARTFATLLQQSAELGSSLVDSLKVYSEEMRNKRMMRAEEKANQLPVKMTVPMMLFIFPILFIILLFPAYMKMKDTGFF